MNKETSKEVASKAARLNTITGTELRALSAEEAEALAANIRSVAVSAMVQREDPDFDEGAEVRREVDPETDISKLLPSYEKIDLNVLSDKFVHELRGVVVPTRATAIRMAEATYFYLAELAKRQ
jgi:hypothetical protein